MKFTLFFGVFICSFLCFHSCGKEPKKGEYKGTFTGKLETDTTYTTVYYFNIIRSTKKELRIQEKQSQIISILKKYEKDSIAGKIGFGGVYQSDMASSVRFNFISIEGKYDENSIRGTFSTTFGDANKIYTSEGNFTILAY